MGIFGAAKKGFGMLKKGKKGVDHKKRLRHPLTDIPEGKTWAGRINPDGTHVRPKKRVGGIMRALKKANKLKGVHGGKGMVALGAGAAGSALWARHEIKKFEKQVKKAQKEGLKKKSKKKQEK